MIPPFVNPMSGGQVPGQLKSAAQWGQPGGAASNYDPTHGYKPPTAPVGPPVSMPGVPPQGAPPQMSTGMPPVVQQPQVQPNVPLMQPAPQHPQQGMRQPQRGNQNQQAMDQMQSQVALQHLRGGKQGGNGRPPMGPMRR